MSYYPANPVMDAIEKAIVADQGARFRVLSGETIPALSDAYSPNEEPFRTHLGASLMGRKCSRYLWMSFHWSKRQKFPARILRLFNRGHLEEGRFVAMLKMIGVHVQEFDEHGKQYRISWASGHAGGSGDGLGYGVPGLPEGSWCVLEFKTHSSKSFAKLTKSGVREAKFEHYVQMQLYMLKFKIPYALYMAVNKDNDEIHAEYIAVEPELGEQYTDRGEKIVFTTQAPERYSKTASNFECKWCDMCDICHIGPDGNRALPDRNCRTCAYSEPSRDGTWHCNFNQNVPQSIPKEVQFTGCTSYVVNGEYL